MSKMSMNKISKSKAPKSKLSKRLTLVYAALFAGILLLLSVAVFWVAYEFLIRKRMSDIKTTMPLISENILHEAWEGEPLDHGGILAEQNTNFDINMFLRDAKGAIVNREYNYEIDEASLPETPRTPQLQFHKNSLLLIAYEQPLEADGELLGFLYIVLNLQHEYDFLRLLAILLLCANAVGAVAALMTGWIVSRRMLSPIQNMICTAKSIDGRALKERLEVPSPDDELKQLALTINGMLARVENAFERQGQFAANASHELRTPLAILQGNADLLTRWGHEDPNVLKDSLIVISQQTAYMSALVENLLFLARGDSAKLELKKGSFSVNELLHELKNEQAALDAHHVYTLQIHQPCNLYADRIMIREMLNALLDNSVKFTPEGGEISIICRQENSQTVIAVTDTGVGMKTEDLEHIFERFYRVDKARSRSTGGMGLGLSIVESIVKMHGGTIFVDSFVGVGTTVEVRFPG